MFFKVTITIDWNGWRQPLGSMVFRWFWSKTTIGNNGFQWLCTIGLGMEWLCTIVKVYSSPISCTSRNWFGTNWAGQKDTSQVRTSQADQTNPECHLTAAQYCLQWGLRLRKWFSSEGWRKRGRKWVHFQGRMVLGRLLKVTPFTLLTLVTGLRVKTIERCELGFK